MKKFEISGFANTAGSATAGPASGSATMKGVVMTVPHGASSAHSSITEAKLSTGEMPYNKQLHPGADLDQG
eukprot:2679102-Rhodomonas_salina.2